MDLLNLQSSERVDLEDFQYALNETPLRFQSAVLQVLLAAPSASPPMSVVRGFNTLFSDSHTITVMKGAAILRRATDAGTSESVVCTNGPDSLAVDVTSFASGTYGVFVHFTYAPGSQSGRTFWNGANGGFEYADIIPTRLMASWEVRVEASLPSADWLQVATVTLPANTLTDARIFYFEGDATAQFASGWGSTADRSDDRANNGTMDLRTFAGAVRQCLEDLKGRGLRRWYSPGIGGMNVGFDTNPLEDRVAVGDVNFYGQGDINNPAWAFANAGGSAITYQRATDRFSISVLGTERLSIDSNGISINGTIGAGTLTTWPNFIARTEAQLSTALASTVSAGGGVIVLATNFSISANYVVPPNTLIQGRLGSSTITVLSGGSLTLTGNAKMRDVIFTTALTSGSIVAITGNGCVMRDCTFTIPSASTGSCIAVSGSSTRICNSVFYGVSGPGATAVGINYTAGSNNLDDSSIFYS